MRRLAVCIVLLFASCASAPPALWNGLAPGPHRVGLQSEKLNSPPHQLPVTLWYPSSGGGTALTVDDLAEMPDYASMMTRNGVPEESARRFVEQRLMARRGATPHDGRYPLILVAQGNGQWAMHQAVLAEFLSSHGFVVATVPSIARLVQSDDFARLITAQTDDLQRAFAFASALSYVDRSRVIVLGHSLGARAALLFATRQPVSAIVSLDGGIGTETGNLAQPRIDSALPPILHVYEERDRERLRTDLTYLRSLPARALELEKLERAGHIHFTTLGFAAATDPAIANATGAGSGVGEDVRRMATVVLRFVSGLRRP
jgi:dienelactone hydrolase